MAYKVYLGKNKSKLNGYDLSLNYYVSTDFQTSY